MRYVNASEQSESRSPSLLPLLRSRVHGDLLAWLYLHPDDDYSTTELASLTGASQPTISREADRLVESGLALESRRGRLRLLRAAVDTVVTRPLTDLLAVTFGPLPVLADELGGVAGLDEAHIYGSWAARYQGEAGPVPRDVDVIAVGSADEDELYDAARRAEERLGREVNIHQMSPAEWSRPSPGPFVTELHSRPLARIQLTRPHRARPRPRPGHQP